MRPDRRRIITGVVVGIAVGSLVWAGHAPPAARTDFDATGIAAQGMLRGMNPYEAARAAVASGRLQYPLFYPATAPTALLPIAWLPFRLLIATWTGLGMGVLAGCLSGWRRWILVSAPAIHAVLLGQWSPWLTAATIVPWLGLVWAAKPTVGLALFAGWPSRSAAMGATLLLLGSLLLTPTWPRDWFAAVRGQLQYLPPIVRPFGVVLLGGWLSWRLPEGRMLGMLALVPHTTVLHETLPLLLCAKTPRQLAVLQGLGYLAAYLVYTRTSYGPADPPRMLREQWPYVLALIYLPAVALTVWRGIGRRDGDSVTRG